MCFSFWGTSSPRPPTGAPPLDGCSKISLKSPESTVIDCWTRLKQDTLKINRAIDQLQKTGDIVNKVKCGMLNFVWTNHVCI